MDKIVEKYYVLQDKENQNFLYVSQGYPCFSKRIRNAKSFNSQKDANDFIFDKANKYKSFVEMFPNECKNLILKLVSIHIEIIKGDN